MIETTTLPNGLRIVTDSIPTVETISLGQWVRIGTRHETAEINGASHFLEHMAFKGTRKRTSLQIVEEIESVGGYLNAFTSREMTAYHARILSQDLPLALDILADILRNSIFDPQEFERERGVIQQELLESLDTPDDQVFDIFQQQAFPDQPLGWPILGTTDTVAAMTPEGVRSYMKQHYAPSTQVFSLAGKLSHQEAVDRISQLFGDIPNFTPPTFEKGSYKGGIKCVQKTLEQTQWLLGFEGLPQGHPLYYCGAILSTLLGGGMSSRLFQEIREKRGLAYSIYSFQNGYRDVGMFNIYASTSPHQVKELTQAVTQELLRFVDTLNEKEIQRAKAQLKAGTLMGLENTSTRCERAAQQTQILGRVLSNQEIMDKIDEVDLISLRTLAEQIFSSVPTCVTLGSNNHTDCIETGLKDLN